MNKNTLSSKNKTILITGTSSGFGYEATKALLKRGHYVIAAMRGDKARFEKVFLQELRNYKNHLFFLPLDVSSANERKQAVTLVQTILEKIKTAPTPHAENNHTEPSYIDALIHNAGYGLMGPVDEMTEEQIRQQIEVNFMAPVLLTNAFLPLMRKALAKDETPSGRIIYVSSICGRVSFPFYGLYAASKHAVTAMAEAQHYDLARKGVAVALLEPGGFKTNFSTTSMMFSNASQKPESINHAAIKNFSAFRDKLNDKLPHMSPVINKLIHLCEAPNINLYNLVGTDANLLNFAHTLLPQSLFTYIKEKAFNGVLHKD